MTRAKVGTLRSRTARTARLEDLHALPASTDVATAGAFFGLSRDTAYDLVRSGEFPCRVLKVGSRYLVPTADLKRALGVEDAAVAAPKSA